MMSLCVQTQGACNFVFGPNIRYHMTPLHWISHDNPYFCFNQIINYCYCNHHIHRIKASSNYVITFESKITDAKTKNTAPERFFSQDSRIRGANCLCHTFAAVWGHLYAQPSVLSTRILVSADILVGSPGKVVFLVVQQNSDGIKASQQVFKIWNNVHCSVLLTCRPLLSMQSVNTIWKLNRMWCLFLGYFDDTNIIWNNKNE